MLARSALLVSLCFFANLASADDQIQYGRITGIVYSPEGAELPNVKLTLSSAALLDGPRTLYSADDGAFTFNNLPPGKYDLKLEQPGLKIINKTGIAISIGKTASMYIAMELPSQEWIDVKEIVADDGEQVNTSSTTQGGTVENRFTDTIPTARTFQNDAILLPGVLGLNRANPNIHGGSFRNNRYLVDGLDLTDPVTLTFSANVNFDAIQEVEALTGGLDAEYNAFGGIINVVTKTGSNDFEFDGSYYVNNKTLSSQTQFSDDVFGGPLKGQEFNNTFDGTSQVNLNAGGAVIKDKAWYYASLTRISSLVPSLDQAELDTMQARLNITYQQNQNNTITVSGNTSPTYLNNIDNQKTQGNSFVTARLDSVLGKNLLFKAQTGFSQGSLTPPGRANVTDVRDRLQLDSSVTYLKDTMWGSHELKTGVQLAPTYYNKNEDKFSALDAGLFLQDDWKPTPFFTIKPGLRVDRFSSSNRTEDQKVLSYAGLGPRLGLAWDPTHDGKTLVAAYVGQSIEPGNLVIPSFVSNPAVILACDPSLLDDPTTAFFFEECRAPKMKEASFIFERQVGDGLKLGVNGIWRHQSHLFEDDEANLIFDERGNNIIGAVNGDTSQSIFRVGTPDEAFIDYKSADIYLQGRPSERSWLLASYSLSHAFGTKDDESTNTQFTSFMDNPRQNLLFLGSLPYDIRHFLKLGGAYEFPFGLTAGAWYTYRSGKPAGINQGTNINDPRDDFALALPDVNQVDLRVQYNLKSLTGQNFILLVDVFNLFNGSTPLAVSQVDDGSLGQVLQRQEPTSVQLGVRYVF